MRTKTASPYYLLFAVVVLLVAFSLRMIELSTSPMWIDETYTLDTLQITRSSGDFIAGMRPRLTHMPLYFASLLFYPDEHSLLSIRYPSVLFALLTIAMTMRIMTHIYQSPRWALLTGLTLAIHALFIVDSRSARMYPLGNFLIATASYLFLRYHKKSSAKHRVQLITYASTALAYLTHIASLTLIPAQGLVKLRQSFNSEITSASIFRWIGLQVLLVLPAIIWAILMFNRTIDGLAWIDRPDVGRVVFVLQTLLLGIFTTDTLPMWWLAIPAFAMPLLLFAMFIRRIQFAEYWLGLTLVPMLGTLLLTPIKPLFHERYFVIALFAYILVAMLGLKALDEQLLSVRYGRWIVNGLTALYLVIITVFTVLQMQNGYFIHPTLTGGQ